MNRYYRYYDPKTSLTTWLDYIETNIEDASDRKTLSGLVLAYAQMKAALEAIAYRVATDDMRAVLARGGFVSANAEEIAADCLEGLEEIK